MKIEIEKVSLIIDLLWDLTYGILLIDDFEGGH